MSPPRTTKFSRRLFDRLVSQLPTSPFYYEIVLQSLNYPLVHRIAWPVYDIHSPRLHVIIIFLGLIDTINHPITAALYVT